MFIVTLLIISVALNVALIWSSFNAVSKVELYEDFIESLLSQLNYTLEQMRSVDIRGAFEADDEVGIVFKGLAAMVNRLDEFIDKQE
jgi:hypothetical protein